jgi:hypothetical protein
LTGLLPSGWFSRHVHQDHFTFNQLKLFADIYALLKQLRQWRLLYRIRIGIRSKKISFRSVQHYTRSGPIFRLFSPLAPVIPALPKERTVVVDNILSFWGMRTTGNLSFAIDDVEGVISLPARG